MVKAMVAAAFISLQMKEVWLTFQVLKGQHVRSNSFEMVTSIVL